MENLFSQLDRQKRLEDYKIALLSRNHPFTGDEIIKWKDKLFFDLLVFNYNVKWTLEALCEVKDLFKWEYLVLKDLSIDDFGILLSLKPYIAQMKIHRKIMLAECILHHKISLQEAIDLVGPTATCLASNCLLGDDILEHYKDDKSLDWKLISKFYALTPETYQKYKKYWLEDELLVNSSIFSHYQLVELFSDKINWRSLHVRYGGNSQFLKFAISYPEYEHLNWSKLSIQKNALEYILSEPDLPFWDWKLIYFVIDLETFHQLKEIIFKRDKHYEMYYNNNPVFLTQQYIERMPLIESFRRSGANKFPQLDEVEERALGIQSVFLKIGSCFEIPKALFEKYYVKDEMIKLDDNQFRGFWKNNSYHLTVDFLSQNEYILERLLIIEKAPYFRVPIVTIRKYPMLILRRNICKPIAFIWSDVVDSYLNSDSIFHDYYFGDRDPAIHQLLMNQYNNDLDSLFSEMSHTV